MLFFVQFGPYKAWAEVDAPDETGVPQALANLVSGGRIHFPIHKIEPAHTPQPHTPEER
jgi:hypothetical protein